MLQPRELQMLRRALLNRLDDLKTQTQHALQYLEAHDLPELENKARIVAAWSRISELIPNDLVADRATDLSRHLRFAQPHDLRDIVQFDVPSIERSVRRYGRAGENLIEEELESLQGDLPAWELLHPIIRDVSREQFDAGYHREAVRLAIEYLLDSLRRVTGRDDDGDQLIRQSVGVKTGDVSFSDCSNGNERNVTTGLKQILQGMNQGVRNPTHHGWTGYSRMECFQILTTCSLICSRIQVVP